MLPTSYADSPPGCSPLLASALPGGAEIARQPQGREDDQGQDRERSGHADDHHGHAGSVHSVHHLRALPFGCSVRWLPGVATRGPFIRRRPLVAAHTAWPARPGGVVRLRLLLGWLLPRWRWPGG